MVSSGDVQGWVTTLTEDQVRTSAVHLIERLIETEDVRFWKDSDAPYWESCGDRLVEGGPMPTPCRSLWKL